MVPAVSKAVGVKISGEIEQTNFRANECMHTIGHLDILHSSKLINSVGKGVFQIIPPSRALR